MSFGEDLILQARQDGRAELRKDTDPVLRAAWDILPMGESCGCYRCVVARILQRHLAASTEAQRIKKVMDDEEV